MSTDKKASSTEPVSEGEEGEILDGPAEVKDEEQLGGELDSGYEKREVFFHASSGYYYDPVPKCYLVAAVAGDVQSSETEGCPAGSSASEGPTAGGKPLALQTEPAPGPPSSSHKPGGGGGGGGGGDLLASIVEVSERMTSRCGLVYDHDYGMYFDREAGLYYDQASRLYFSAEQQSYYFYCDQQQQYRFHSRAHAPATPTGDGEGEDCGLEEPYTSPVPSPPVGVASEAWTPCLRLVVQDSNVLTKGDVTIVTKLGADIGREVADVHDLRIKDVYVSKRHATVAFDEDEDQFYLRDRSSMCGTFLNGSRLAESKRESPPHPLQHGDTVVMGTSTFAVHIHRGLEVCPVCSSELQRSSTIQRGQELYREGGVAQDRRDVLGALKKKYGIKGSTVRSRGAGYQDRAEKRRRLHGDEPFLPSGPPATETASVFRPLATSNLGHQLLSKMGWQEGQGLGADGKGNPLPVVVAVRDPGVGLGSSHASTMLGGGARTEQSRKMLQRASSASRAPPPPPSPSNQHWVSGGSVPPTQ